MKKERKFDVRTLVDLVVNTARSDTTSPIPGDQRKGWLTDQLFGEIDKLMIYNRVNPAAYAQIGRRVQAKVYDLPEMEALAHIAVIRGERLGRPASAQRKDRVSVSIAEAEAKIASLPPGPRKERLASLLTYNKSVFYDAYEMFAQASEMQGDSAKIAQTNGDKSGEAIGRFLQAVYQLKDTLCQKSTDEAHAVFSIMEERYAKLVEAVRGTALEVSWGQGNAPCHMFQACVWLNENHPNTEKWVASVVYAAGCLQGVWTDIAKHYLAINFFRKGEGQAKIELAKTEIEKVAAKSGDATRKAEALLVLARSAIADGDKKLARKLVKKMPQKGTSHLRAVAERLL